MHYTFVVILMVSLNSPSIDTIGLGRTQSVAVEGVLVCGNSPASNVKIKLYDDDRGIDTDDLMGETRTDQYGHFYVKGHTREFTDIDPKVNIYHRCNYGGICYKKLTFWVPKDYISAGKQPSMKYNMGTIQLALKYKGESTDCINKR
ncbi:hypothetical protein AB6A40_002821 [Gnathostoma spinigerum]|uniref:Transthyretin-like family protein n=1 Tax=Gnathostoma spinigerum TaxID=75299 RepID=A0ABD6EHF2_9BILA